MSETQETRTAERDGCTCPSWVERCAHFDGKILVLHRPWLESWYVCECEHPQDGGHSAHSAHSARWRSDENASLDEAVTAFETEERRLLGREP